MRSMEKNPNSTKHTHKNNGGHAIDDPSMEDRRDATSSTLQFRWKKLWADGTMVVGAFELSLSLHSRDMRCALCSAIFLSSIISSAEFLEKGYP